jgi:hypothetical protein
MICELYPDFPYIMREETYRTIMVTISVVFSGLLLALIKYYIGYRKQQDWDKLIVQERLRINVEGIVVGIKGSPAIMANGKFTEAYDNFVEKETSESLILNPQKVPHNI